MPLQSIIDSSQDLVAKVLGAVAGSAISLASILPRRRREAALRFLTGLVAGIVFGGPAGLKLMAILELDHPMTSFEIALSGAAATSLCAWWTLGILARYASRLSS